MRSGILSRFYQPLRKISILKRLLCLIVCLVLIPNIILSFAINTEANEQFQENINSYYTNSLSNVRKNVEQRILDAEKNAIQIALDGDILESLSQNQYSESAQEKLNGYFSSFSSQSQPYLLNLMAITPTMQYNAGPATATGATIQCDYELLKETSYYSDTKKNRLSPVWSSAGNQRYLFSYYSEPRIYLSNYITLCIGLEYNNQFVGHLIAIFSSDLFQSLYTSNQENGESFFLYNSESFVTTLNSYATSNPAIYQYVLHSSFSNSQGNFYDQIDGEKYLIFYTDTQISDWYIVAVVHSSKAFQHLYYIQQRSVTLTLLITTLSVLLAIMISLSISIPLTKLNQSVHKAGQKDLDFEYEDPYHDEIGQLGDAFSFMMQRIRKLVNSMLAIELDKKNEQIRRKKAELQALQMQIKPHFLYNTLDIIRWNALGLEKQCHSQDGKVSNTVFLLSKMLSYNTKSNSELVSIYDELEHVRSYLKLIQYTKQYQIHLEVSPDSEKYLCCNIVHLTLQPIVENAIIHGFKRSQKPQKIYVSIRKKRDCLLLSVIDHGAGIPEDQLEKLNQSIEKGEMDSHIGLKNINERLKLSMGESYGLKVYSKQKCFTSVVLRLPLT
ncbi:MAG: sensor histidine kinase [Massiliimalia sp.]|jgi:two-component system sensor histidine kinase YesM